MKCIKGKVVSLLRKILTTGVANGPIVEGERVGKLLWKHTARLEEFRSECEEETKEMLRYNRKRLEERIATFQDQNLRDMALEGVVLFKVIPEHYKE
jgi:uncharacterized protein YicC (UPF0701 family)